MWFDEGQSLEAEKREGAPQDKAKGKNGEKDAPILKG